MFIFPLTDQNASSIVEAQTELSTFTNTSSQPVERESELYVIPNIRAQPASPVYDLPQSEKYEYPTPLSNTHHYEYPSFDEPTLMNENEDPEQKHNEKVSAVVSGYTPLIIPPIKNESTDHVYTHLIKVHQDKEEMVTIKATDKPTALLNPTDGDYTPLVRPPTSNESTDNDYTHLIKVKKEKEDTTTISIEENDKPTGLLNPVDGDYTPLVRSASNNESADNDYTHLINVQKEKEAGTVEQIDGRDGILNPEEDGDYTPLVRSGSNNESADNGYTHLINIDKENVNTATAEKTDKPDQLVNPDDEDYTPLVRLPLRNDEPVRYEHLIKNNKRNEEPETSEKTDELDELLYVDVINSDNVTIKKKK